MSNTGKVRNRKGEISQREDKYGYMRCNLYFDGTHIVRTIHRLVAEAFLPNPENLPQVNHIDGNKKKNHVENLEWCTASQNVKHAFDTGLKEKSREHARKIGIEHNKKTSKPVLVTDNDGNEFLYNSVSEACRQLNVTRANAQAVLNGNRRGKRNTAGGYKWMYATGR